MKMQSYLSKIDDPNMMPLLKMMFDEKSLQIAKKKMKKKIQKYKNKQKKKEELIKQYQIRYDCGICRNCDSKRLEYNKLCKKCYLSIMAYSYLRDGKKWKILLNILEKQKYRCVYSGVELKLGLNTALDHIRPRSKFPELMYNIDNFQWLYRAVNRMKSNLIEEDFLEIIKTIYLNLGLK